MSLSPGDRLGPYEILAAIGAGGMGEVFRARDTRLGRTVAIKILPAALAADPERRARFEREARAISALSHPHICALYDVGRHHDLDFLVMEHLEGETLARRLEDGPVPLDQALEYAGQIAAALHDAHRLGIVHRDLKPANVMLTRTGARLLDFGLARLRADGSPGAPLRDTVSTLTAAHTFVGTIPYMSPEQLQAQDADSRSDIFSFGIVLFELVTGRLPFDGDTTTSVIARILQTEPPGLTAVSPGLPKSLERLIRHCLIKSPDLRWQSARDLELALAAIRSSLADANGQAISPPAARRRTLVTVGIGALLVVAGAGAGYGVSRGWPVAPVGRPAPAVQFALALAPDESIPEHNSSSVALAADGSRVVYAANRPNARGLYLRNLGAPAAGWIAGADRATSPFFSPDGQWVAFESGGSLKKVHVDGGTPVRLCDTPYFAGGSWGPDGLVLVPSFTSGLFRIPATGGRPVRLTTVNQEQGERAHVWPQVLSDGRVLFTIWTGGSFDESKLALLAPSTGRYVAVLEGGFHGRYTAGRLIFSRANRLYAAPFDLDRAQVTGATEQIADGIAGDSGSGVSMFTVDGLGTLAYVPGSQRPIPRMLVAVDPSGAREPISDGARAFISARVSPDGRRLAVWTEEAAAAVWVKDLSRAPLTRLTFSGDDHGPVWSPDGRWIGFESGRASTHHIFVRAADGSGEDRQVTTGEHHQYLNDWSPDGRSIVYTEFHPDTGADLWIVNVEGTPQPRPFRATPVTEKQATFSPDGQWLAYVANDSDQNEVYVQSLAGDDRMQISSEGGEEPAWSRSGDRLFYRSGGRMMQVPVQTSPAFNAGRPAVLFEGLYHYNISPSRTYDILPDGRFVMISLPDPASAPRHINVVLNRFR